MKGQSDIEQFCQTVRRILAERRTRLDAILAMTDKTKARDALDQFNAEHAQMTKGKDYETDKRMESTKHQGNPPQRGASLSQR